RDRTLQRSRARPKLPRASGSDHHALRRGRRAGHHHAHARATADHAVGQAGAGGQQAGRGQHARHGARGKGAEGWPHAAGSVDSARCGAGVYPSLSYDARRDFAPLSLVGMTPEVLVVTPSLGVASVAELVAKAKSGKQNFGSAGSGTLGHLAADSVNRRLNLGATHIPYKGSNPATIDLIGGQIDWMMDTPAAVLPHVRSGKLRALAVAAPQRSPQLADVPTLAEAGYPELEFRIWMGLMAPAGT